MMKEISPEELPEGDEFINYVMALEYLKPEEAQRGGGAPASRAAPGALFLATYLRPCAGR